MTLGGDNFGIGHGFGTQKQGPAPPPPTFYILTQDGYIVAAENGDLIIQE